MITVSDAIPNTWLSRLTPEPLGLGLDLATTTKQTSNPSSFTAGQRVAGRFIARLCPQVMEFGVINESIHKIDEWVDVAALEPLKNVYRQTLERFLA